jgi:hypothetical protein
MERPVSSSRPASRLGTTLALCAGVTLGHTWAFAQPPKPTSTRTTPRPSAPRQAPVKPATVQQAPPVFQQAAPPPPGCAPAVTVGDAAFYPLSGGGLRDASVWIDDIDSGLSGRFLPFEVYVVTGRVSAPFSLKEGKLTRDGFQKYTGGNYNTVVEKPIVVDRDTRRGERAFRQGGRTFTLKILNVQAATFSRDTVTLQLCW